ncbi:RNA-binding protein 26 [Aphelenchoides avenae]|nr:RNA-binding protein 26 [Aphelenchus avenae]
MPANCTTLMLRNIPAELNTVKSLSDHFSQFGTLQHVRIAFDDDSTSAFVVFEDPQAAQSAYASERPVLNNRFIRIFWHVRDEEKLRQAAELLRGADVDMENSETAVEEDETQAPTPCYPNRDVYTKYYGKLAEANLTPSAASSPTHDERAALARDVKLFQAKCRLYLEKSEECKQRLLDLKSCSDGSSNKVLSYTVGNIEKLLDTLRPQISDLHASIMERAKELPPPSSVTNLVEGIDKEFSTMNSSAAALAPSSDYSSFYSGSNGPTSPEEDGDDEGISVLV